MAQKKSPAKKAAAKAPAKAPAKAKLEVFIPTGLRDKFKKKVEKNGTTMTAAIGELVKVYVG